MIYFLTELDDDVKTDKEEKDDKSESESDHSEEDDKEVFDEDLLPIETPYLPNQYEELGQVGAKSVLPYTSFVSFASILV